VTSADTSGLLAFFNRREPEHESVRRAVERLTEPLVVSPYVVAELDYLVGERVGAGAALAVLRELAGGAYTLAGFDAADLRRAAEVIERYRDQHIGVADASIVVLAERFSTRQVLTLDHRHFNVLRPLTGGRFRLLP
jgi:predicted nucleic acid-binding protein